MTLQRPICDSAIWYLAYIRRCAFAVAAAGALTVAQYAGAQSSINQQQGTQGGNVANGSNNFGNNNGSNSSSRRQTSNFSSGQNSSSNRSVFGERDRERNRNNSSRGTNRSNSRESGQQANQSATGIQRQDGRQQLRTVRGQQAPRGQRGGASKPVVVEFKMKANPNTNVLYMEGLDGVIPSLNMLAEEGTTFPVRVMFANPRSSRVREVEISLKYDSSLVQPKTLDDSPIAARLEAEATMDVDRRRGMVTYRAKFAEPASDSVLELLRIEFLAESAASHASLSFQNTEKYPTRLLNDDGVNVLQLRDEDGEVVSSERTGLLDASIAISPSKESRRNLRDQEGTLRGITMANAISAGTAVGGMRLSLSPRQSTARIGEEFLVDVNYNNPNSAELDSVKLRILFDPRFLEVLDSDEGNWITKGVNILDGPYQEDLPFDFHRRNIAYNTRGEIQYDAGFNSRVRIPPTGTIATIRFRAKQPISNTPVAFAIDEERPERETSISFLGFNLIGSPGRRAVALNDAVLSVRP